MKLIVPGKLDGVYAFAMLLRSVTVSDVANRRNVFLAARCQLIYGPVVGNRRPQASCPQSTNDLEDLVGSHTVESRCRDI